jgi:hypothetical protein
MKRGEQNRAAVVSRKDKRPPNVASDLDASLDSDVKRAALPEARRNRDRELKRQVTATVEDNEALDRQLAGAEAKKKATGSAGYASQFIAGDLNSMWSVVGCNVIPWVTLQVDPVPESPVPVAVMPSDADHFNLLKRNHLMKVINAELVPIVISTKGTD